LVPAHHVAKIPPAVPRVTTYAVDTDRMAGPAALFADHARNPGPPGKAPMVIKKMPPYRTSGLVAHRMIEKPAIAGSVKIAR
jgi:hypothetical protein